jgi:hypothetical protein
MKEIQLYHPQEFEVNQAIRELIRGGSNAGGIITLDAGATSTQLDNEYLSPYSVVSFTPETSSAAGVLSTMYVDGYKQGQCTIHHSNTSDVDKTFRYVIHSRGA